MFLYGFALPAALGTTLWIFARIGKVGAAQPFFIAAGGALWNLGVLAGVIGIFAGHSTGFENMEMPRYAAVLLFFGFLLIGIWTLVTLHERRDRRLGVTQWFLLAALFWFPWIYSTAQLLLVVWPARGTAQAVIHWWFSANFTVLWCGLAGLGVVFYFIEHVAGRPLHNSPLAVFALWTSLLFVSWTGIPAGAPVPAWIPTLSTIAGVVSVVPLIALAMVLVPTLRATDVPPSAGGEITSHRSAWCRLTSTVPGRLVASGLVAFLVAWVVQLICAIPSVNGFVQFTWFTYALSQLNLYAFLALTLFGAIYLIAPRVAGMDWPWPKVVRLHFWLAVIGIALIVLPLAAGGLLQASKFASKASHPELSFVTVANGTLHFLRISSIGEVLLLLGHVLLAGNLLTLMARCARARLAAAYESAVAEVRTAEVKP